MTIRERLAMEEGNTGRMYIHLDGGLFHKLYEHLNSQSIHSA